MSLLLSLLGTAAIAGGVVTSPIAASANTFSVSTQDNDVKFDIIDLDHKIESEVTSGHGGLNKSLRQNVTEDVFKLNWEKDLKLESIGDYFRIDWQNSMFILNLTLYYKGNVWGNSGTTYKKQEIYQGDQLRMMFIQPTKMYEDGRLESAWGREIEHTWEYLFNDTGRDLVFTSKIWTSAKYNYAWTYASMTFDTFAYKIELKN